MKTYEIEFYGRLKGAIGIFYTITDTVQAENKEAAILKLYDKYDSVQRPKIKEVLSK